MPRDYFAILGLTPGRYEPAEITRRFFQARARLLRELSDPAKHADSRRQLDDLHLAYAVVRDPQLQAAHLDPDAQQQDRIGQMRRLIAASLEDGLLRYSRRNEILDEGRRLGFSDFQTQLLIVQVQFGDDEFVATPRRRLAQPGRGFLGRILAPRDGGDASRIAARFAAVALTALALFLTMLIWLGGAE